MAFKDPSVGQATQFQPGVSGNPNGVPKGTKHISTYIQKYMDKEITPEEGAKKIPRMEALIGVAFKKALVDGDQRWADWLGKYGYAQKIQMSGDPDNDTPISIGNLTEAQLRERLKELTSEGN